MSSQTKLTKVLAALLGCAVICIVVLAVKLNSLSQAHAAHSAANHAAHGNSANSHAGHGGANSAANLANSVNSGGNSAQSGANSHAAMHGSIANSQSTSGTNSNANSHSNMHAMMHGGSNSSTGNSDSQNPPKPDLSIYRTLYAKPVSEWAKPNIDPSVESEWQELAPLPQVVFPEDNKYSIIKAYLGLKLFNEPKLSKSGQIACQNCHNAQLGFGDGTSVSFGHDRQKGRRNSPNIQMAAFYDKLFWDGRADSLEMQALMPMVDPVEMANTLEVSEKSAKQLSKLYPLFALAFGDENMVKSWGAHYPDLLKTDENATREFRADRVKIDPQTLKKFTPAQINAVKKLITTENIAKAIATYERSPFVVPTNTRFNRFIKGEYDRLTDEELWGLDLFRNKGECMNCHYGAILSDNKFHNVGLSYFGEERQDLGRYEITGDKADLGKFKTPSLVNVRNTAPYFHTGGFGNLRMTLTMGYNTAFSMYETEADKNRKGDPLYPVKDPLIRDLNLTRDEMNALVAFLNTL